MQIYFTNNYDITFKAPYLVKIDDISLNITNHDNCQIEN